MASITSSNACGRISSVDELALVLSEKVTARQSFDLTADITHIRPSPQINGNVELCIALRSRRNGSNAIIFRPLQKGEIPPKPGDRIRCKGYVKMSNRHAVALTTEPVTVISHGAPPSPVKLSIQKLLKGNYEYSFVKTSGTVYDARPSETNKRYLLLSIVDGDSIVEASSYITEEEALRCSELIGAKVDIEGVYSTDDGVRHHIGGNIKLAGFSSLKVLKPANEGDDTPPISKLDNCSADNIPLFVRHHVIGQVIATMDSRVLLMTQEGKYVCAELIGGTMPAYGSTIKATGFPTTDLVNVNLVKATWEAAECITREEQPATAVKASMLNVNQIGYGLSAFHGKRVSISGKVFTPIDGRHHQDIIYIVSDGLPFKIYAPFNEAAGIEDGSTVEITGTCMIDSESWHKRETTPKIYGFVIVTRSIGDIRIISRPPWWNFNRLLVVVGTLLIAIVGTIIWNRQLSKLAEQRGKELLKAQLANARSQMKILERTRLAVELHDSIAQDLTGVSMELTTAELLGEGAPTEMRAHLDAATHALKACREELRNYIWDLRSNVLEESTLSKAILRSLKCQDGKMQDPSRNAT